MDGRTPAPSSTKLGVNWENLVHDRILDFCLDKGDSIGRHGTNVEIAHTHTHTHTHTHS
jgi:hypothetical protein